MFTVHFTSNRPIKKYDAKGKVVSIDPVGTPMMVTPCSKETALIYKDCDNFRMEEIVRVFTKSGPPVMGIGNGTKKFEPVQEGRKKGEITATVSSGKGRSRIQEAAATGDMSGAINE